MAKFIPHTLRTLTLCCLFWASLNSTQALACSCPSLSEAELLQNHSDIFSAVLVREEPADEARFYSIVEVTEVVKGDLSLGQTVRFINYRGTSCFLAIGAGIEALYFANRDKAGSLSIAPCHTQSDHVAACLEKGEVSDTLIRLRAMKP